MENEQLVRQQLEDAALRYADLRYVSVEPCGEPLVPIAPNERLSVAQIGEDMRAVSGEQIYVRQSVAERLGVASLLLAAQNTGLGLQVVYGYRTLSIQQRLFDGFKAELSDRYQGDELLEAVHRLIAVPDVAGHPTGGAVDIQIVRGDEPLQFGTDIWEFATESFTFWPFISEVAVANRMLLRAVMLAVGFAPFDGEWWHFSYGDKEWAKYYDQPNAIYEQLTWESTGV
ncbi:MAG: dipeptidase [Candidatus Saccharibacteria bacterium]|nr:dipeptidase [Candidatus Saccharibacteria bacterium]